MSAPDPMKVLAGLLRTAGLDNGALNEITLTGAEPVLPSSFAVGTACKPRSRQRRWRPASCGDCAPGGASLSASTCAARRSSSAASDTCTSTVNRPLTITATLPVSIAAAMAVGCGSIPTCRITVAACWRCSAARQPGGGSARA